MASTTTFGEFPGVKVTTVGGAITGVAVGREQKLILVGRGDTSAGSASVNTATQIQSRVDANRKFGDSELAEQMRDALANGANIDFLYGVAWETSSTTESVTSTTGITLPDAPIYEDESSTGSGNEGTGTLTVTDTSASDDLTVEFRYSSPPASPSQSDTAFVNPITGEVEINSSNSNFDITYEHPDIQSALGEAESVIGTEETGLIAMCTENEDVASTLSGAINPLRGEYKMAQGVTAAEPTGGQQNDPSTPDYDTSQSGYSDSIDNDAMYLHAPARKENSQRTITGAVSGLMAGEPLGPGGAIYGDSLTLGNLSDRLTTTESRQLSEDKNVIPIRQPPQGGSVEVEGNTSTSEKTDWIRDYWRRRIVDQVILIAKAVGDSAIGQINDEDTRDTVETTIKSELNDLNDDRLITTNYFVDVYKIDSDTIGIDVGITPFGIAKRIEVSITVNT
jgi:hypothetical protein